MDTNQRKGISALRLCLHLNVGRTIRGIWQMVMATSTDPIGQANRYVHPAVRLNEFILKITTKRSCGGANRKESCLKSPKGRIQTLCLAMSGEHKIQTELDINQEVPSSSLSCQLKDL